jgi:hypothetical protein
MNIPGTRRKRSQPIQPLILETLEGRTLLAASLQTFLAPSVADLMRLGTFGINTGPAAIQRFVNSLQSQLNSGPLANLNDFSIIDHEFVEEVQSLKLSFEQSIDTEFQSSAPNIDQLIKLQGQRISADMVAAYRENTADVYASMPLASQAQTAFQSLSTQALFSLGTPLKAFASMTESFETNLNNLAISLGPIIVGPGPPLQPLVLFVANDTLIAESEAYRADLHAALQVTHPVLSNAVDKAVDNLENSFSNVDQNNDPIAQQQLRTAIKTFDKAMLDKTGLFGPIGLMSQAVAKHGVLTPNLTASQSTTTVTNISGTATLGGTASLTAKLISSSGNRPLANQWVQFILSGTFAGRAKTNNNGVATLTNVDAFDPRGINKGAFVVSFAGVIHKYSSTASGDLTVNAAPDALS